MARLRTAWILGAGLVLVAAVVGGLVPVRAHITLATPALVLVLVVVAAAWVGGTRVAVAIAVVAALSFNVAFIRPYWTFKVAAWDNWIALWVFVAVVFAIGVLVAAQTEHRRAVEQREIELRALYENLAEARRPAPSARAGGWPALRPPAAPSPTICARRWRRSGRWSRTCATACLRRRRRGPSCSRPSATRPSGSTVWSPTSSA